MAHEVVLESVESGFHGPVVAALLTVRIPSRTKWKEVGGFRNGTTVGLGLSPEHASRLALTPSSLVVRGVTAEDAEYIKAYLEAGHYPEKKEWARPEQGRTCCSARIQAAG